ncbi:integrator complex subunit 9 homolog isoform X2 [Coffea eugenioides]|nr:integrator complex subunit 9 homolog isoform X2 [Coffea eugenioides]
MKTTCLSEGKGYHFPPCHMLNIGGFQLLFDCPLDLSALSVFSPLPTNLSSLFDESVGECTCEASSISDCGWKRKQKVDKSLDTSSLIHAEPWYKTVKSLKLWNISFIDVVLISSPVGMLGLPFLTRNRNFSAKIYATEATARLGQLMMEDLVKMHNEIRQFYGPEESTCPEWMKWDEVELLPSAIREILWGRDGDLCGWMPLYSVADVKGCMQNVQSLKYAEEACYNGTLLIRAFSSGLDIGTCNWSISSPKQRIAYLSSSIFASATATEIDYNPLRGSDVILFSDSTACDALDKLENEDDGFNPADKKASKFSSKDDDEESYTEFLQNEDKFAEELEKLAFLCSCSLDSVKAGGSVLIPIARLGVLLQLLECITLSLQSSDLKVPIYIISSVAEELVAFLNVIPEWLCKQRQDKFYSGQPLFAFMDLLNEKRLFLFPVLHSPELLSIWHEPCIVICPHWSLRIGPAVHLLQHWCGDKNSLLVMEEGFNANLAFLPFKSMEIKVLQCSFLSGMNFRKAEFLLKLLKPKYVLFPEKLKQGKSFVNQSFSVIYYLENETVKVPKLKDSSELDIGIDLACQLGYTKLEKEEMSIARLKGELLVEQGKNVLFSGKECAGSSETRPLLYLGGVNLENFLTTLQSMGINATVEEAMTTDGSDKTSLVHILGPKKALIEVTAARTIVSTDDEYLSALISKAICNILNIV